MMISRCLIYADTPENAKKLLVGTDLVPVLTKGAVLYFSHSFANKWAVSADFGLWFYRKLNSTEKEHYIQFQEELSDMSVRGTDSFRHEITIQFWPDTAFKGHFISFGLRYGNKSRTDCILEYGYRIRLAKGFGVSCSIKAGINSIIRKTPINSNLIKIGISYDF